MNLLEKIQQFFQKFSQGVTRVFSPNDDHYPEIGVEPFEGEVNSEDENKS